MGDVSEFFKSGFLGLYKNTIGKNFQQKTLEDRVNNFNCTRRQTRSTLMFQKRQIDENMTPINTPEQCKIVKNAVETKHRNVSNKRLDMLQKWKIEKEKRKREEKQRAKPVFKVCHVPNEIGLPNLENVNKKIKGKPINANVSHSRSQFAPPNHTFHAPKSIKPIYMHSNVKSTSMETNNLQGMKTENYKNTNMSSIKAKPSPGKKRSLITNKVKTVRTVKSTNSKQKTASSRMERKNIKTKTGETTLIHAMNIENKSVPSTSMSSTKAKPNSEKKYPLIADKVKSVGASKGKTVSNTNSISNKNKFIDVKSKRKETLKEKSELDTSLKLSPELVVKTVGWNSIEVIGEDSNSKNIKTPKTIAKKYNKTPRKGHKLDMPDVELIEECDIVKIKENHSQSMPRNVKNVKARLRKSKSNPELKKLNQLEQKESDTKSRNSTIGSATGSASPDYPMDKNPTELCSVFHTPQKDNCADFPVYISPFVTVSRGKSRARKEYEMRHSTGEVSPEFDVNILSNMSPKVGGDYFLKKLNNEVKRIEGICDVWECYKNSNNLPEEATDMINVAIGQSKLLISKKFEQFRNLINQCRKREYVERPISCEDLHGFWDMIYMQVEDLNKRFNNLDALKANNWQEVLPERKIVKKRGRGRPRKVPLANTALKNHIKAARTMKKSNTECEMNLNVPQIVDTKEFNAGYYSVKSPIRTLNEPCINEGARRSLRVSLLTNQAKKRLSSSPGLIMMKVSQVIKCRDSVTPSKSILKNDLTKSEKRITKSVLFKDNIEGDIETKVVCAREEERYDGKDVGTNEINLINFSPAICATEELCNDEDMENNVNKENNINEINLISFSPATPVRRSKRLNKIKVSEK